MKEKFDDIERQLVLRYLENIFKNTLQRVGDKRILVTNEYGECYCVLGGIDFWHGIPKDLVESQDEICKEMYLVFAKKYKERIEVFFGSMDPLIMNKHRLNFNENKYFFNIKSIEGDYLTIRELPNYHLEKIGEFPYSEEDKDSVRNVNEITKLAKKMSEEELTKLAEMIEERIKQQRN